MTDEFENLDRRPLYARVADSISAMIADTGLRPGDDLPSEADLCARAGVSRVVVRGALAHLAGAGHIKLSNGRKAQVIAMNPDVLENTFSHGLATSQFSVNKVLEVRRGVETSTAALAAENRSDAQVAQLLSLCELMEQAVGDPDAFAELDYRFHLCIAEATDNPLYVYIVKPLREIMKHSITVGRLAQSSEREQNRIVEDHRIIQRAIANGDARGAADAMEVHFSSASDALTRNETETTTGPTT
ncbi:FadR/GntR family transcriptional regulator [Shimia thalassica]|uniref:FadR/GntR family transcriptional regulator n=1 Tax=Shimia thalassica TaxID=1715693 RepID=UPI002735842D|nr:FadR/GntR family transcriptional regulator [Shimia thalassica]MDP2519793.1 FadR/GntR family transcriptional regulator [Shimia thalassica]